MKKTIASFSILLITCHLFFITFLQSANAHILKSDGSIGAVLHIDPNDDPVAGEVSTFFFELKDTENKFKAEDCTCHFRVLSNGKEVYKESAQSDENTLSGTYIFPSKNIYIIEITGTSLTNTFTPFTLSYDIRVERTSTTENMLPVQNEPKTNYILFVFVVIIFVGVIMGMSRLSKRTVTQK